MIDLACAVLSVALLCCHAIVRPGHAACPLGWMVTAVHRDGVYECRRRPGGDPLYDGAGGYPDRTVVRLGWHLGRVYCHGGVPIVVLAQRDDDTRFITCSSGVK